MNFLANVQVLSRGHFTVNFFSCQFLFFCRYEIKCPVSSCRIVQSVSSMCMFAIKWTVCPIEPGVSQPGMPPTLPKRGASGSAPVGRPKGGGGTLLSVPSSSTDCTQSSSLVMHVYKNVPTASSASNAHQPVSSSVMCSDVSAVDDELPWEHKEAHVYAPLLRQFPGGSAQGLLQALHHSPATLQDALKKPQLQDVLHAIQITMFHGDGLRFEGFTPASPAQMAACYMLPRLGAHQRASYMQHAQVSITAFLRTAVPACRMSPVWNVDWHALPLVLRYCKFCLSQFCCLLCSKMALTCHAGACVHMPSHGRMPQRSSSRLAL